MNPPTPTTVLLTLVLLLLLTPGLEVRALSINERRLPQRLFNGHRRFQQPRVISNPFHGQSTPNLRRSHVYSKDITRPFVTYDASVSSPGDGGTRDPLRRHALMDHLVGFLNSLPAGGSLKPAEGARWTNMKNTINRRMGSYMTRINEPRTIFFNSVGDWTTALQQAMKRDAVYNVGKIGGIIILYYFFPGILSWINDTFGSF